MDTTLEVLTKGRSRHEAHRQWPDEVKARIVSESLRPGVMVNEVASALALRPITCSHGEHWRGRASWSCLRRKMQSNSRPWLSRCPRRSRQPPGRFLAPRLSWASSRSVLRKGHLRHGSPLSRAPWRRRHDFSIESRADHGGDQTGQFPQGPWQRSMPRMRQTLLPGPRSQKHERAIAAPVLSIFPVWKR